MDAAVADLIEAAPFMANGGGLARARATDLDRYVRLEFQERETRWFLDSIRRFLAELAECDSDSDARLLRRFVRAIAEMR